MGKNYVGRRFLISTGQILFGLINEEGWDGLGMQRFWERSVTEV
jgi:hypothetical protein